MLQQGCLLSHMSAVWLNARLLHSPSWVAVGLAMRCETWPLIGWSIYRLGNSSHLMHYGPTWPMGLPIVFRRPLTVPLRSPIGGSLPLWQCKETVNECSWLVSHTLACILWWGHMCHEIHSSPWGKKVQTTSRNSRKTLIYIHIIKRSQTLKQFPLASVEIY